MGNDKASGRSGQRQKMEGWTEQTEGRATSEGLRQEFPELSKWNRYRIRLRSQKLPQPEKWDSCNEQNSDGRNQGSQCTKDIRAMQGGRLRMRTTSQFGSRRYQACGSR